MSEAACIADGELHLWQANLDALADEIDSFMELLCPREKSRAARFRFTEDRDRYVVAHGVLRRLLGPYLGVPAQEVRFIYGEFGKPGLPAMPADEYIYFNLSHTQGIALYGFTRAFPVGVDIERLRHVPDMEQVAGQFFSAAETEAFHRLAGLKRVRAFYRCWTVKEAFVKAVGQGLHYPLERIEVCIDPDEPARLLRVDGDGDEAAAWWVQELMPAAGLTGAVAARGTPPRLRYQSVQKPK